MFFRAVSAGSRLEALRGSFEGQDKSVPADATKRKKQIPRPSHPSACESGMCRGPRRLSPSKRKTGVCWGPRRQAS
jgi:hypothetical protein